MLAAERSEATGQNQCIGSIQTVAATTRPMTGPAPRGTPVSDQSSSYMNQKARNHSGPAMRRIMPRYSVAAAACARGSLVLQHPGLLERLGGPRRPRGDTALLVHEPLLVEAVQQGR